MPQPTTGDLSKATDLELLAAWQQRRDQPAAAALWLRYQALALAVAARMLRELPQPMEDARELCDHCFVRALGTFDVARCVPGVARPFRNWFLAIVRNGALDLVRKGRVRGRLGEVHLVDDDDCVEASVAARQEMQADLVRILPKVHAYVLEHFLPSDWELLQAWMKYAKAGERVPWGTLVEAHRLRVDLKLPFRPDSVVFDATQLAPLVRLLNACVTVQITVDGGHSALEPAELGMRRAQRVVEVLLAEVVMKRLPHVDRGGDARVVLGVGDLNAPMAQFRITQGEVRSAAALRMRVTQVLLPKIRQRLADGPSTVQSPWSLDHGTG